MELQSTRKVGENPASLALRVAFENRCNLTSARIVYTLFAQQRGISSVGRALAWHARGQGFKSPILHDPGQFARIAPGLLLSTAQKVLGNFFSKTSRLVVSRTSMRHLTLL
jgi:hypothetical protein